MKINEDPSQVLAKRSITERTEMCDKVIIICDGSTPKKGTIIALQMYWLLLNPIW